MQQLSALNRNQVKDQLKSKEYDVVIIGGGITGAGIALDASQRGMKVALVEMQDFAQGTSSRSTKLVHGGLRYLKQLQVGVVAETGKERAIVYENGPHVTTPEWMLLPMHKGGSMGPFSTSIGLKVYDFLAGVKKSERRSMLNRDETIEKEPLVKQDGLKGGGYYVEYRTDDARLTIEVMKRAREFGADIINYAKANQFLYNKKNKVSGVEVTDLLHNEMFEIKGKRVINAAGPWVDDVRSKDYSTNNKQFRLTKGVHIVIDQSVFPLGQAVYFDTESDGRMIFAIPREGKAYVGTTDTVYDNDKSSPKVTEEDRQTLEEQMDLSMEATKSVMFQLVDTMEFRYSKETYYLTHMLMDFSLDRANMEEIAADMGETTEGIPEDFNVAFSMEFNFANHGEVFDIVVPEGAPTFDEASSTEESATEDTESLEESTTEESVPAEETSEETTEVPAEESSVEETTEESSEAAE